MPSDKTSVTSLFPARFQAVLLPAVGAFFMVYGLYVVICALQGSLLDTDLTFLGKGAALFALKPGGDQVTLFLLHNRLAFGGTLFILGVLFIWMTAVPLKQGYSWAWWLCTFSGSVVSVSMALLIVYRSGPGWQLALASVPGVILIPGLAGSRSQVLGVDRPGVLWDRGFLPGPRSRYGVGRLMILLASFALFIGGLSVAWSGVTGVMVPLDLEHNGIGLGRIQALSPRLMDLIRQDGLVLGSVVSLTGFLLFFVTWCSPSSGSFYSVLVIIFAAGTAITLFQHFFIGH